MSNAEKYPASKSFLRIMSQVGIWAVSKPHINDVANELEALLKENENLKEENRELNLELDCNRDQRE